MRVVAGDCTTVYEGDRTYEKRGRVVCVCKPDDTVLVHDEAGYQPVAWLTRPETTTVRDPVDPDGPTVEARDGDAVLRVFVHDEHESAEFRTSAAGHPVGPCADCDGALVRASGTVSCTECDVEHGLPAGGELLDETCDCGLPRVRAVRGHPFEVCLDPACDPLADKVAAAFEGEWDCPACGSALRVRTPNRGGRPFLGCGAYPDCTASFSLPRGELAGTCDCGAPAFRVDRDEDETCLACG